MKNTVGVVLLLTLLAWPTARAAAYGQGGEKPKKPRPKFTISKETTYVTGPVDKDGYIDYQAALNERLRQGVTPANNANVLLWQAFGPHPEGGPDMPPEFFEWLGIKPPPEQGDYFLDPGHYAKKHFQGDRVRQVFKELNDQAEVAVQRPWTAKQYPEMAAWLKANEKPLALVTAATKRSHYYSPLIVGKKQPGPPGLLSARLPSVAQCRESAFALSARAMLRTGEGHCDEAWQDLLTCHRLGRHVAHGNTLIEVLVGLAIDAIANRADLAFLERADLKTAQIKACLRDLQNLPPMPAPADEINWSERFVALETVMILDRYGPGYLQFKGQPPPPAPLTGKINWDPALRNLNHWYDRLVAAMRQQNPRLRKVLLRQLENKLKTLKGKVANSLPWEALFADASTRSERMGDILVGLYLPAIYRIQEAADRVEQEQHNVHLAFALAAYRRDHGSYPNTLAALAPHYLATIPQDLFSGEGLIYRPATNSYLLYSVGINGRDDLGRGYDDNPPGDDLSVRMPLPPLQRP